VVDSQVTRGIILALVPISMGEKLQRECFVKLSWVFDVISPFAYLSLKELSRLPPGVEVEFVPVLFAGLLNHFGQVGNAEIETKRQFTYRFVLWRAMSLGIAMRMPPAHPFNPLQALRLIVAAGSNHRAVETVFDAVFLRGRDVTDPATIADLAKRLNVADPGQILNDATVKQKLIRRGVFGVPTFVIGEQIFWGHDSLDMTIDYLRDPRQFENAEMERIKSLPIGVVRSQKH
jgi:2-hydroxychromene-2-carboxylate isomerase